jgi:FHS family L-fucose permease-like MFS transporter
MGFFSVAIVALLAVGVLLPGWIGMWAIFLTSFFMSLMFPTIFALGIKGLGVNTKIGGSLLVMGVAGGGVFTPLMGLISKNGSMALAMLVPLACYVFIAWYSFVGSRVRHVELSRG